MKVKYFGAWPPNNVSQGGKRNSPDEYNKEFKGDPYNLKYKKKHYRNATGYMSADVEEYHRVPEQKDMTSDSDEKNNGVAVASRFLKTAAAKRKRVIGQAVVMLAASIIIVSSYQAMASRQNDSNTDDPSVTSVTDGETDPTDNSSDDTTPSSDTQDTTASQSNDTTGGTTAPDQGGVTSASDGQSETDPSATTDDKHSEKSDSDSSVTTSWNWSSDYKSATLTVKDSSGNVTDTVKADITESKKAATCNKDGKITYTAKAESDGKTYSDSKSKTISALGHKFDSGKEITLDDGSPAMEFICKRCDEHFVVKNSVDEE